MLNVTEQTGFEVITDDKLVSMIRTFDERQAEHERLKIRVSDTRERHIEAEEARQALEGREHTLEEQRAAARALRQAERAAGMADHKLEESGELLYDASCEFRERMDDVHRVDAVLWNGAIYLADTLDGDMAEAKLLAPSGTALVSGDNHPNATPTVARCHCGNYTAEADTISMSPSADSLWLGTIRRAITARLEARAWNQEVSAIAREIKPPIAPYATWYALDSTTGSAEHLAESWLAGCILAHAGLIKDAGDIDDLPDDWTPVVLTLDGQTYVVRSERESIDDKPGKPVVEITEPSRIASLSS